MSLAFANANRRGEVEGKGKGEGKRNGKGGGTCEGNGEIDGEGIESPTRFPFRGINGLRRERNLEEICTGAAGRG